MKNAQEMLDHLAEFSKEQFDKCGQVTPMWIVEGPDDIVPIVTPFTGVDGEKEAVHEFVRNKAKEINAHVIGFIAEAWQITRNTWDDFDVAPSECDDRVEVIQVTAEDRNGTKMGHYIICRPDGEKPYLSPFEVMDATGATGRFVGTLEKFNA